MTVLERSFSNVGEIYVNGSLIVTHEVSPDDQVHIELIGEGLEDVKIVPSPPFLIIRRVGDAPSNVSGSVNIKGGGVVGTAVGVNRGTISTSYSFSGDDKPKVVVGNEADQIRLHIKKPDGVDLHVGS